MTENLDYSKVAGDTKPQSTELLAQISTLADQQRDIEIEITKLEDTLKDKKRALAKIAEDELPRIMDELEIEEFSTKSGLKVKIKEDIRAQISKERSEAAIAWLEEHGFANLVRREFIILFNREDTAWANKFQGDLKKRKKQLDVERRHSVNSSTLRSWAKERLTLGDTPDFPEELFGIFRQRVSKVEVPKGKKS